jgi:hypothetical protein
VNYLSNLVSSGTLGGGLALVKDGSSTWNMYNATNFVVPDYQSLAINGGTVLLASVAGGQNLRQQFGAATAVSLANVAGAQLDLGTEIFMVY